MNASLAQTILVIDDSATFREELKWALEEAGYAVITAASGEEGLRLAAARRPTALIVDGVMPGIDGATTIGRMRLDVALRGLPCLLLTASEEQGAELRALEAGADAFVRKDEEMDVILARFAAMLRTVRTEPQSGGAAAASKRILAVDDSITILQATAALLREEGYEVLLASSGEEALERLAVESVDCILLDLQMPGIGGEETCRRIKSSAGLRDIPVILVTAVEERQTLIDGLGAGADDYMSKSNDFEVLRARIQAQIRRRQFEDQSRAQQLSEAKAELIEELKYKNDELEAFSYSVSHDLRAPLRGIDGFSQALIEDYADKLDETGRNYLSRIRSAAQRMGELIDDMLLLARVSRAQIERERVDISAVALAVAEELQRQDPERRVTVRVEAGLFLQADRGLMRVLLENLLGNAWKFTGRAENARIEFGAQVDVVVDTTAGATVEASTASPDRVFFVRDNGAGFDMAHANTLFKPFQRLHAVTDFPGTGIGLATVRRIVDRHGGRIWAEGAVGQGASLFFTIPAARGEAQR